MMPELQLIIGTIMLAAVLSYAWWVSLRVWMLRQDLFSIRDDLWDAMKARGLLDDPAHREMRDALNAFIRVAPRFSVLTFFGILAEGAVPRRADPARVTPEIEAARLRASLVTIHKAFDAVSLLPDADRARVRLGHLPGLRLDLDPIPDRQGRHSPTGGDGHGFNGIDRHGVTRGEHTCPSDSPDLKGGPAMSGPHILDVGQVPVGQGLPCRDPDRSAGQALPYEGGCPTSRADRPWIGRIPG